MTTGGAPWFFIVDAEGRTYEEDRGLSIRSNRDPPRTLGEVPVQATAANTLNLAFVVPKEIARPRLWAQRIGLDGSVETAVIDLGQSTD